MSSAPRTALVTGAARRLGRAVALELAADGHDMVVHYGRSESEAQSVAETIRELGRRAWTVAADLADPAQIAALFDEVRQCAGRLDVLVNSAASFERRPLETVDAAAWDAVTAVNLRAPALCVGDALPLLRAAAADSGESSCVVNLVDHAADQPWRGYSAHGAAKAGLLQWTRTAALELAPEVRVNAVQPGPVLPPPGVDRESDEWRGVGEAMPLGRPGDPVDVARAVTYLTRATYTTGALLVVDGGEHLLGNTKR